MPRKSAQPGSKAAKNEDNQGAKGLAWWLRRRTPTALHP
jgi:hypothetical protein